MCEKDSPFPQYLRHVYWVFDRSTRSTRSESLIYNIFNILLKQQLCYYWNNYTRHIQAINHGKWRRACTTKSIIYCMQSVCRFRVKFGFGCYLRSASVRFFSSGRNESPMAHIQVIQNETCNSPEQRSASVCICKKRLTHWDTQRDKFLRNIYYCMWLVRVCC